MGLLTKALELRSLEDPRIPLTDAAAWFDAFGAISRTDAGVDVSVETAMKFAAVYACMNILAQPIAQVPWDVMRVTGDRREVARDRYEHWLLHNEPNGKHTSYVFRTTLMANALGRGNGYAEIVRDGANKARKIIPLTNSPVTVLEHPTQDRLVYEVVRRNGVRERLDGADVIHLPCISLTGDVGLSPVSQMKQGIGLGIAAERAGASLFANGIRPAGMVTSDKALTPKQEEDLNEKYKAAFVGSHNTGKALLMSGGLKWQQLTINPEDAQALQTREFQVADIARGYKVPGQMLGLKDASPTYASAEAFFRAFVTYSLGPWVTAIEQEFNRKLFPNQTDVYCKLDMRGLMRGDSSARATFYKDLFAMGALSPNDIAELEDMNPIEGGDKHFVPLNIVSLEAAGKPPVAKPAAPNATDQALRSAHANWLADVTKRVAKWERRDAGKVAEALAPVFDSLAASVASYGSTEPQNFALELARDLPVSPDIAFADSAIDKFLSA
jgi:HK97 family phage portal protein